MGETVEQLGPSPAELSRRGAPHHQVWWAIGGQWTTFSIDDMPILYDPSRAEEIFGIVTSHPDVDMARITCGGKIVREWRVTQPTN